jgi:hypothetical protein
MVAASESSVPSVALPTESLLLSIAVASRIWACVTPNRFSTGT